MQSCVQILIFKITNVGMRKGSMHIFLRKIRKNYLREFGNVLIFCGSYLCELKNVSAVCEI